MWRRFDAEGAEWEVRAIPTSADVGQAAGGAMQEVLEFRSSDRNRPPRRLVVESGALGEMDEPELRSALRRMNDMRQDAKRRSRQAPKLRRGFPARGTFRSIESSCFAASPLGVFASAC